MDVNPITNSLHQGTRERELNDRLEKARQALAVKEKERAQRQAAEHEIQNAPFIPPPFSPHADDDFPLKNGYVSLDCITVLILIGSPAVKVAR